MENLIIYGNSSMARTYYSYLKKHYNILGFAIENSLFTQGQLLYDKPIYEFETLHSVINLPFKMIIAVGYSEMNDIRARIFNKAIELGYELTSFIHPSIEIHENLSFGLNTVIFENTSIHCDTQIGNNVFISSGVNIGHDCKIGDNSWLNSGVTLAGSVTLSENTFMGINSCVAHNIQVMPYSYVGANTLVNKNTLPHSVTISKAGEVFPFKSKKFLKISEL